MKPVGVVEGRCRETAGFLFAHPCKRAASSACKDCQKPICATHNRQGRCIACFRQQPAQAAANAADPFLMATWYYADYETYSAYDAYSRKDREAFADGGDDLPDDDEWGADWEADFDGT